MLKLYLLLEFWCIGFFWVSDLYEIYWEELGNFNGLFVIGIYGGFGGGLSLEMCWFFDFSVCCIILID